MCVCVCVCVCVYVYMWPMMKLHMIKFSTDLPTFSFFIRTDNTLSALQFY